MTVWGEGVFLLNAALDYLLLAAAIRLRGGILIRRRLVGAALIGGMAALLDLHAHSPLWGVLGLLLVLLCAYGFALETLRCGMIFLFLSCALCGIAEWLAAVFSLGMVLWRDGVLLLISWRALLASAGILYGICTMLGGVIRNRSRRLLPTRVTACGRTVQFRSLVDTGSFLSDPINGRSVLLADAAIAGTLFSLTQEQLRRPDQTIQMLAAQHPQLRPRLIPYRTIGTAYGMLLGVTCTEIKLGAERQCGTILALSPEAFSADGTYHGLTGG